MSSFWRDPPSCGLILLAAPLYFLAYGIVEWVRRTQGAHVAALFGGDTLFSRENAREAAHGLLIVLAVAVVIVIGVVIVTTGSCQP